MKLARAHTPEAVVGLLRDAATEAVGPCEIRLRWRPTGSRQRFAGPDKSQTANVLDELVTRGHVAPMFYASPAALPCELSTGEVHSSWAVLPVDAVDMEAVLVLACQTPQLFADKQQKFFITLMNLTSLSLARTSALVLHRSIADTLQAALLPDVDLADSIILERQLIVADGATMAGGDWLDAFTLENGNQIVLIGDVVGHGAEAAGQSSVIRHTLRTLLLTGYSLPEALYLADRLLTNQHANSQGSVLGVEINPAEAVARIVSCGHPPPIAAKASGNLEILKMRPLPLIGFGLVTAPPEATEINLRSNSLILLTDGLIERRDQNIDAGYKVIISALQNKKTPNDIMMVLMNHADRSPLHDDALFAVCALANN